MRTLIAALFLGIPLVGCSSSYIVSTNSVDEHKSFSEFNAIVQNENATILLQDDSKIYGRAVLATPDSASWLDPRTGLRAAVPIHKIKKIILTNRGLGLLEGAGIGTLGGGALGFLVAIPIATFVEWKGLVYAVFSSIGGGAGLLVGAVYGLVEGHTYEYEFTNRSASK